MMTLYVALGGAIGAALRFWAVSAAGRVFGIAFPYGTLAVNILGSLLMGVVIGWMSKSLPHSHELRVFLAVGLLGGFTTFSAFSLDVLTLIENHQLMQAAAYILLSVCGGVCALFLALWLMRWFS